MEATVASMWSFYTIWLLVGLLGVMELCNLVIKFWRGRGRSIAVGVGVGYIGLSVAMILSMEPMMVLTFITIVWANDTGAYLVGSTVGRHKMSPKISPKKSWEGFFGGLLFAVGGALVWYSFYWSVQNPDGVQLFSQSAFFNTTTKILWLCFGLLIGLAAVVGDLLESKFKRVLGVKDSGTLIPGHGGILDRFDATFMASIVVWLYVVVFGII